jgi:hypothetical protein
MKIIFVHSGIFSGAQKAKIGAAAVEADGSL